MENGAISVVMSKLLESLAWRRRDAGERRLQISLQDLVDELNEMQLFCRNSRVMKRQSIPIKDFLQGITNLACAIEDLIDPLRLELDWKMQRRRRLERHLLSTLRYVLHPCLLIAPPNPYDQILAFTNTAREIRTRLASELDNNHVDVISEIKQPEMLFGIEHHVELIWERLRDQCNRGRSSVVPIIGMPGIGKTTLARRVFETEEAEHDYFKTFAWWSVCIMNPSIAGSYKLVIEGDAEHAREEIAFVRDELKQLVRNTLRSGRRYLIVLDNIRSRDQWEMVEDVLREHSAFNGSGCVLTTSRFVLAVPSSIPPYQLPLLSMNQSMDFIRHYFVRRYLCPSMPEALLKIDSARMVVMRCGGLPLALMALTQRFITRVGSFPEPDEWKAALDDMDDTCTSSGWYTECCLDVLATIYQDLREIYPIDCFLYLGSMSGRHTRKTEASKLIRLWVAEGFIDEDYSMERNIPQEFLNSLVLCSMIQPIETDLDGNVVSFTIHPVLHDFCVLEAGRTRILQNIDRRLQTGPYDPRRLALHHSSYWDDSKQVIYRKFFPDEKVSLDIEVDSRIRTSIEITNLRSLFFTNVAPIKLPLSWLRFLRVVDLDGVTSMSKLPEDIGDAISLRYLGLRGCSGLTELPMSIAYLPHLQTLDVRKTGIQRLPELLGNITTLMYLMAPDSDLRGPIYSLTNLLTLEVSEGGMWLEYDLKGLSKIRSLSLKCTFSYDWGEFCNSFRRLVKLEHLYLKSRELILPPFSVDLYNINMQHMLQKLHLRGPMTPPELPNIRNDELYILPNNIRILTLDGSKLEVDPMPTLGKLRKLEHLTLKNDAYVGKTIFFDFDWLRELKCLKMWCLRELQDWVMTSSSRSFTSLSVGMCGKLSMIPGGLQNMLHLKELEVIDRRNEFINRLRIGGDDWHKIRHVPSIKLNQ